jgi:hypothetical protein
VIPVLLPTSHASIRTKSRHYIPRKYGSKKPQLATTSTDKITFLLPEQKTEIQAIIGTILYYARAVDPTLLLVVNEMISQQTAPTQVALKAANRLLSYCARNLNNNIVYYSCDISGLELISKHPDTLYYLKFGLDFVWNLAISYLTWILYGIWL